MEENYKSMIKETLDFVRRNNLFNLTLKESRMFDVFVNDSIDKNTPIKVDLYAGLYGTTSCECPNCKDKITDIEDRYEYCPYCGQKLEFCLHK